ncbi:MAG: (deoxy)nucleoside triphosphate pyrophosphohydrolase [Galactobacillus timonensis]|uniref:(deoxy)nucleoside triphosphate pyrophosphohydrolase n=1 Tax=Galactobacillus timonensis TaxID=2041840 RepID=UPI0023F0B66D|nr:(deoxy)nucleoside triphosphate pyrophosphohydrolase [Galactobacillus timonensis]MCI6067223.1 (deoxy)nucleoside triphosphate pyrophosphohydrolase [Galactobacillus timonensis]MDD5852328.1 (deoxy)nucleoside triphosphate pyrophosphohydrolase [Galactobacillus timonensis]MDD6599446.1 (deoxy)nucleoside triphosphate pyrophosphohydrolase [Galactobacillus timonensis]
MNAQTKTVRVAAAMILENHQVFATQRGYGEFKDGWEFPGGKIEKDESGDRAVVREIQEELASIVEPVQLLTTIEMDYPSFHLSMECWICHLVDGNLCLLEAEDARWLSRKTIDSVAWLPADKEVVTQLKESGLL